MSTCTAAEIAEKRRIALEKLQRSKQARLETNAHTNGNPQPNSRTQPTESENAFRTALNALKHNTKPTPFARNTACASSSPQAAALNSNPNRNKPQNAGSNTGFQTKPLAPVFLNVISCKVLMTSAERFTVQPSGFHAKLIDVFKTIPSRSYDSNTRYWSFGLKDYQLVQERVGALKPQVVIGNIPKKVLDLCAKPPAELDYTCLASIEPTLANKLLPFQQDGVCFAIAQNGCAMICDEMGLGKTYQALAIADFYKENWPLLICTTASTRETWSTHVRQLLPSVPLHYVQVLSGNEYIGDARVLITSYSMLGIQVEKLVERKFGFLIFDESHQLKSAKAKCSVAAGRLAKQAKRVILLSGTPALSRPLELFTQLKMIDSKFMSYMEFTTRYCDGKQTHFGWDASGQSNLSELNVILTLKFMIRRIKADVLPEMTEKSRETVVLDPALVWPNEDTKETLNKVALNLSVSKGHQREQILIQFYAQTAEVKARAVCAYLKMLVKDKIKFIVFAHHRIMMDAISNCLSKLKVSFIRIDGQTKNETRAEYIKAFQTQPACQVAVLSLRACNSGITLTAAEMIIFAELDWNPSTLAQAESRAHRIGQDKPVICRYLMASKTADDVIWKMLKNKQDVLNNAGLFCENLQNATHSAAPTMSNTIERYFSPNKSQLSAAIVTPQKPLTTQPASSSTSGLAATAASIKSNLSKELDNMADFVDCTNDVFKPQQKLLMQPTSSALLNIGTATPTKTDLSKELENIAEFFQDDDELFKDIVL